MEDEQKGKCPVCTVEIRCDEKIGVRTIVDRCAPATPNARRQEPEKFLLLTQGSCLRGQAVVVEDWEENDHEEDIIIEGGKKDDNYDVELDAGLRFVDLSVGIGYIKEGLGMLQDSSSTLTPVPWNRSRRFFTDTAHIKEGSKRRKIDIATFSSGGTEFTMNNLRQTLSSAEDWTMEDVAAVLGGKQVANKDSMSLRKLEKKLADIQAEIEERKSEKKIADIRAEIEELKDLESCEIARREEAEFEKWKNHESRENARYWEASIKIECIREINKKADEEVLRIRAEAEDEVERVRARASAEIAKLHSHRKVAGV